MSLHYRLKIKDKLPEVKCTIKLMFIAEGLPAEQIFTSVHLCLLAVKHEKLLTWQIYLETMKREEKAVCALLDSKDTNQAQLFLNLPDLILQQMIPAMSTAQAAILLAHTKSSSRVKWFDIYRGCNKAFVDEVMNKVSTYQTHLFLDLLASADKSDISARIAKNGTAWSRLINPELESSIKKVSSFGLKEIDKIEMTSLRYFLQVDIDPLSSLVAAMIKARIKEISINLHNLEDLLVEIDSRSMLVIFQRHLPSLGFAYVQEQIDFIDAVFAVNRQFSGNPAFLFECKKNDTPETVFGHLLEHLRLIGLHKDEEFSPLSSNLTLFQTNKSVAWLIKQYSELAEDWAKKSDQHKEIFQSHLAKSAEVKMMLQ